MDDVYRGVFSTLYNTAWPGARQNNVWYLRTQPREVDLAEPLRRIIDNTSDEVQRDSNVQVRADAKYFLLVNLTEMLLTPLLLAQRESPQQLLDAAAHDVQLLIRDAAKQPGTPVNSEVSAHRIVDTLSQNWKRLKLSEFRLWDGGSA